MRRAGWESVLRWGLCFLFRVLVVGVEVAPLAVVGVLLGGVGAVLGVAHLAGLAI